MECQSVCVVVTFCTCSGGCREDALDFAEFACAECQRAELLPGIASTGALEVDVNQAEYGGFSHEVVLLDRFPELDDGFPQVRGGKIGDDAAHEHGAAVWVLKVVYGLPSFAGEQGERGKRVCLKSVGCWVQPVAVPVLKTPVRRPLRVRLWRLAAGGRLRPRNGRRYKGAGT